MKRTEYFRNYRAANREKLAIKNKAWWANNPDKSREYARKRREENPDENKLKMQAWRAKNPERAKAIGRAGYYRNHEKRLVLRRSYKAKRTDQLRERQRRWMEEQRKGNPTFRLLENLRHRISLLLRKKIRSNSSSQFLGCSLDDFKIHLESFFESGMSWSNYGKGRDQWSVDHVMPCAIFDLSKPEQQRRCFHFSNLRPMWHVENMRKHTKVVTNQFNLL